MGEDVKDISYRLLQCHHRDTGIEVGSAEIHFLFTRTGSCNRTECDIDLAVLHFLKQFRKRGCLVLPFPAHPSGNHFPQFDGDTSESTVVVNDEWRLYGDSNGEHLVSLCLGVDRLGLGVIRKHEETGNHQNEMKHHGYILSHCLGLRFTVITPFIIGQ